MKLLVSLLAATRSELAVDSISNPQDIDEIAKCGADLSIAEVELCQVKKYVKKF